jgi:hypothetical protein
MPPKLFAELASSPTMPLSPVLSSIEQGRRPSATLTGQPLPLPGYAARTFYVPPICTQPASVCTLARGLPLLTRKARDCHSPGEPAARAQAGRICPSDVSSLSWPGNSVHMARGGHPAGSLTQGLPPIRLISSSRDMPSRSQKSWACSRSTGSGRTRDASSAACGNPMRRSLSTTYCLLCCMAITSPCLNLTPRWRRCQPGGSPLGVHCSAGLPLDLSLTRARRVPLASHPVLGKGRPPHSCTGRTYDEVYVLAARPRL